MAEDKNMTMYIVIGIIALAAAYLFMSKKKGAPFMNAGGTLDDLVAQQRQGIPFGPDVGYNPIDPTEATKPGSLAAWPNNEKIGLPIISGSIDSMNQKEFDVSAAGACQCSDKECCYYAPFYDKYGEQRGYGNPRKCTRIYYGNTPEACEKAFDEYTRENARFNSARAAVSYYAFHPTAARSAARLQNARFARAMR